MRLNKYHLLITILLITFLLAGCHKTEGFLSGDSNDGML